MRKMIFPIVQDSLGYDYDYIYNYYIWGEQEATPRDLPAPACIVGHRHTEAHLPPCHRGRL